MIELSIKAGVKVNEHDPELRETIERAWRIYGSSPLDSRRYGLVAPNMSVGLDSLKRLAFLAMEHEDTSDFMRSAFSSGVMAERHRKRFLAVRALLGAVNGAAVDDRVYHSFLRRFVLVPLDLELPPATDLNTLLIALQGYQGISRDQASILVRHLISLTEDAAIASSAFDRAGLSRRLRADNVAFGMSSDLRATFDALEDYANRAREATRDDIAGLVLDRSAIVDSVIEKLEQRNVAFVIGPSGAGKSVILQRVFRQLSARGPVLYLSGWRVQASGSWAALCDDIGIPRNRRELISALAGHETGVTIVIDAIEHVESVVARAAVNDLLAACVQALDAGVSDRVKVVIGTRDHLLHEVTSWLKLDGLPSVARISVGSVSEDEALEIQKQSLRLGQLLARVKGNHITRNLLILRLLGDERIPESALPRDNASEVDMLQAWWEHVLVADGEGLGRLEAIYSAAAASAQSPSGLVVLGGLDWAAVKSLVRDNVLVRDPSSDKYRFGHDILQEWAMFRWLNREPEMLDARLREFSHSIGFYRPVSLVAQEMLERGDQRFERLLDDFAKHEDLKRWHQVFIGAMVISTKSRTILAARAQSLMTQESRLLRDLIVATRTEEVNIEEAKLNFAIEQHLDAAAATAFALRDPEPRFVVWAPLIQFCLAHLDAMGGSALAQLVGLLETWQRRGVPGFPFRRRILEIGQALLEQLESWRPRTIGDAAVFPILYDESLSVEKLARSIVAYSGDVDPELVCSYMRDLAASGYWRDQEDLLTHAAGLAATVPEELANFAISVLLDRDVRRPGEADMTDMGLRSHTYYPPSDVKGPFLALLLINEDAGIRLVRELVNHATEYYGAEMARGGKYSRNAAHFRVLSLRVGSSTVAVSGDERVYSWFRYGSHDSSVLTSALMALETWAYRALDQGRDAAETISKLLYGARSVAHLGIAIGLAYDFREVIELLVDAIALPAIWRLEVHRESLDRATEADSLGFLPAEWRFPELEPEIKVHNRDRDARRARHRIMLVLVAELLYRRDDLRADFLKQCQAKGVPAACLFVEEAEQWKEADYAQEIYSEFVAKTNPDNFTIEGGSVRWVPPLAMRPSAALVEIQALRQAIISSDLVSATALQDYRPPSGEPSIFLEVGRRAQAALVSGQLQGDDVVYARHAMVRNAALVLAFDRDISERESDFVWCIEVVRSAAEELQLRNWDRTQEDHQVGDIRVSIATGLGAAYALCPSDAVVRELLFSSVASGLVAVAAGAMRGVIPLWRRRPATPLNLLGVIGRLSLSGERKARLRTTDYAKIVAAESNGKRLPLPRIKRGAKFAAYRVSAGMSALPRRIDNAAARDALLPFVSDLVRHLRAQSIDEQRRELELEMNVAATAVNLLSSLTGARAAEFLKLLSDWRGSPDLYAELISGFARNLLIDEDLDDETILQFERLCAPFLQSDHSGALAKQYLPESVKAIAWHMVFIQGIIPHVMPDDWRHAARLRNHVTTWVKAIGAHPESFGALTLFLGQFADAFDATDIVDWTFESWRNTSESLRGAFWEQSGGRTAQLLMRAYLRDPGSVLGSVPTRTRLIDMTEELVRRGFSVANELRKSIEGANKR